MKMCWCLQPRLAPACRHFLAAHTSASRAGDWLSWQRSAVLRVGGCCDAARHPCRCISETHDSRNSVPHMASMLTDWLTVCPVCRRNRAMQLLHACVTLHGPSASSMSTALNTCSNKLCTSPACRCIADTADDLPGHGRGVCARRDRRVPSRCTARRRHHRG